METDEKVKIPQQDTEIYERCVICGELTNVLKTTHIDFREFYELGCGQLCVTCYNELYKDK